MTVVIECLRTWWTLNYKLSGMKLPFSLANIYRAALLVIVLGWTKQACVLHLHHPAERCFPTRKQFSVYVEHTWGHDLPWQCIKQLLFIMPWSMFFLWQHCSGSCYKFVSWMGTLTIKCPDKALDGEEPMKGEVVHWWAKYKQLPSKEMLICNWSVVVQFSCNTGAEARV